MDIKKISLTCMCILLAGSCRHNNPAESDLTVSEKNVTITAQPQPVMTMQLKPPFTLKQCINIALTNNPDVISSTFDAASANAEKDIAASKSIPHLALTGNYRYFLDDQRLLAPRYANEPGVFSDDILTGNIVLSMPIFTKGRIKNEINAARLLSQSREHTLVRTKEELVFNVSNVFYRILTQKHIIESLIFSKNTMKKHKMRVNDLIAVQKAAKVDLLRTEVRLAHIEYHIAAAKNTMSILRRTLVNLLGISTPQFKPEITGDLQITDINADLSAGIKNALNQRADYLSVKKMVLAQYQRLNIARSGHWPLVSVDASYGMRNAVNPSFYPAGTKETEDMGFIGVNARIPLFEGGAIKAKIRKEKARLLSMQAHLRKIRMRIYLDVETSVLNINSAQQRITSAKTAIAQATESLRIEREKYALGKGSITSVLDAQTEMLDAQTNYYNALADYHNAIAQWHLALGDNQ